MRLLRERYLPVAVDVWYEQRQKDEQGEFFYKVAQQGHNRNRDLDDTRQGLYCFTADGTLLGSNNHRRPERVKQLLLDSLTKWEESADGGIAHSDVPALAADPRFQRTPPINGLILDVFSRILRTPEELGVAEDGWSPNMATGRDHLWLTEPEWRSLVPKEAGMGERFQISEAIVSRIARFHLTDNVRGEPDMWRVHEVRASEMMLTVIHWTPERITLRLEGSARLATDSGARGYEPTLTGILEYDRTRDALTRFDLLGRGDCWGHSTYTGGEPTGRFPLAIAFRLAGDAPADCVPPQGARNLRDYLGL